MSGKFRNRKATNFIASLQTTDIENSRIASRCKFNFSYLETSQSGTKDFSDLTPDQQNELFQKLKNFSANALSYWQLQTVGHSGGHVLEIYGKFPRYSEFQAPKYVPHDVHWGRFRLDRTGRLCGFVIPKSSEITFCSKSGHPFDYNTFYVVLIDTEHGFYKTAP